MIELKFCGQNWWGYEIYRTVKGTPIVYLKGEGYYTLTDPNDIDSDPDKRLKSDSIKIVKEFTKENDYGK